LGLFDCSEKQYDVVFIVNKDHRYFLQTIQGLELHSEEIPKRGDSDSEARFIQSKRKKEWFVMPQKAKDPFSAAENRIRMLADNAAIYRMSDHNYRFDLSQLRCGVYDDRGTFYYLNDETSPVQRIKTPNRETINTNSNRVGAAIETAVNRHHVHEAFALLNAIRAHSLSLDSDSDKNQLLDLWSIFETILDISNKHTSDRIQQVCLYLVPILKRKYFYSLFAQLANDIRIYSSETYDSIVEGETDEFKAVKKLVEYVLLDERKAERDVFLAACSDFPLLKERVEYYHSQLCTPVKINEFAEKHAERVRWQVMRIYRNRNMIIHNGESSTYLKLLVENLHSYVDDFIDYVVQAVLRGFDHRTMSQELFVKECEWREAFDNKKAVLDSELIEKMLQI